MLPLQPIPLEFNFLKALSKARSQKFVGLFSQKRGTRDFRVLVSSFGRSFRKCHFKWNRLYNPTTLQSYPKQSDGIHRIFFKHNSVVKNDLLDGRDIASFQKVLSPYKRDTNWHNERFHRSTSIVLQEAPQLTTPPVFSSNDQSWTPHSPSTILQLMCQRQSRRPYCQQQAKRPTFCPWLTLQQTSSLALPQPARFWPSGDLLSQTALAHSVLRDTTVPPFLEHFNTVWPLGDFCHNIHIFCSDLF